MRPSKKIYWTAQIFGWISYSSILFLVANNERPSEISPSFYIQLLIITVVHIICTHIMRNIIIRLQWLDRKFSELIPRILLISFLCSVCIVIIINILEAFLLSRQLDLTDIQSIVITSLIYSFVIITWNAIYFTYHFFHKLRQQEVNNLALESSKNEIELKILRSQLNPHFLFNSLNSIRALIDLDPQNAKHAVTTMSNLLRKSLIFGKENLITISEEFELIRHYLELEKIRFEERLTIEWEIDTTLEQFTIPPFSVQLLVENAIKHGISKQISGGTIKICSYSEDEYIFISVENTGQMGTSRDIGIGIENTIRRLKLQYHDKADFTIQQLDNTVLALLKFHYEKH